jgi:hypothetical protein
MNNDEGKNDISYSGCQTHEIHDEMKENGRTEGHKRRLILDDNVVATSKFATREDGRASHK